jgi:hypothetical protein
MAPSMLTQSAIELVRERCEAALRGNWREGRLEDSTPFAYTCPSPRRYPWQWYWDSCFTAITWRRLDRARSRRELESLLAAQRPDGFIGHTIFWDQRVTGTRRWTYNITAPDATMTASIQPPALAWAWGVAVGDPAVEPRILAHYEWLGTHRDLDGDGLIWIVQPDESGLDASTQFDAVWGRRAHSLPGFVLLVRRNRALGYDLWRIHDAGGPVCCEVLTNVIYNLSRLALGLPSTTEALIERTYDEGRGLFLPQARPQPRTIPAATIAALTPLALPDLPETIGRRLVEEHLLDTEQFWLPIPPPSVSRADPSFALKDTGLFGQRRYWRGPTWINTAWLVWLGLVRLGYGQPAQLLAECLGATVASQGLREYYHPYSGAGMGADRFGWSSLVLELLEPDPAAERSHLTAWVAPP